MRSTFLVLEHNMETWAEKISETTLVQKPVKKIRRVFLELLDSLNIPNFQQHKILNSLLNIMSKLPNCEKSNLRHLLTRLYPSPTLRDRPIDIEVFILTVEKDIEILELSILGAIQSSINRVISVTVVAPVVLKMKICKLLEGINTATILKFVSDEDLLERCGFAEFTFVKPNIKMEILKVLAVIESECEAALVIDGDTVLLKERNWVTRDKQIALVAQEYTPAHIHFSRNFLKLKNLSGLGFVTHHQLIRRSDLLELISEKDGLIGFVEYFDGVAADFYLRSGLGFPSEWQLFGDYLLSRHPERAVLTSFRNLGMSRNLVGYFREDANKSAIEEIVRIKKIVPNLASLSFHAYKD